MLNQLQENEINYYNANLIEKDERLVAVNLQDVVIRAVAIFFEPFTERPQDIFFCKGFGLQLVGRKLVSQQRLNNKINGTKCSQITASMLLGILERHQMTDKGIIIFYRPFLAGEKLDVFTTLTKNNKTDIYFPFPFLTTNNQENVSPVDFWNVKENQVENLNNGEEHIREYTIHFLSKFDLTNKKIFDPACSTGEFLHAIKQKFSNVYTIGQDLNPQMVKYAHSRVDEIYEGNSLNTPVKEESVDFIFFRFLNLEVVSTPQAYELFAKIGNCCKNGGNIILLGHTPILLSAEWFEAMGLRVIQNSGYHEKSGSIFQYYILKKLQPIPNFNYEKITVFNHQSLFLKLKFDQHTDNHSSFFSSRPQDPILNNRVNLNECDPKSSLS